MAASLFWEQLSEPGRAGKLERTRVPGGWLVREYQEVTHHFPSRGIVEGYDWRVALAFVPDPEHVWLREISSTRSVQK